MDVAEISALTPQERVEKGAERLTHFFGGNSWKERVDVSTLNLWSLSQCVLGQVFGHWQRAQSTGGFVVGLEELFGPIEDADDNVAYVHGFAGDDDVKQAWVELITGEHAENCDA